MNKLEEIATEEVYLKNGTYHIRVPIDFLMNPKFLVKENILHVYSFNYTICYIIKEIAPEVSEAIKKGRCYLVTGLEEKTEHYIDLTPN